MKNSTLLILSLFCFALTTNQANAQDGYTYTLVDNGSYSYTVSAVPNASSSNFATSVQSYGFTIIVPDGVSTTIMSSLGNSGGANAFDGSAVGMPTIDGYLISETLTAPINLTELPASGTPTPMVTIQVNGTPSTGNISLLANDSSLATTVIALKCFMSADMVDDAMAIFPPVVDPAGSGLSGTTSYSFQTLGTQEYIITDLQVSVFPNPASEYINISSSIKMDSVELFDLLGKRVLETEQTNQIRVDQLPHGVYLLKIYTENGNLTKKVIIEK